MPPRGQELVTDTQWNGKGGEKPLKCPHIMLLPLATLKALQPKARGIPPSIPKPLATIGRSRS